jgi:uncharacterized membrane protein YraQ (UPF0718 family)
MIEKQDEEKVDGYKKEQANRTLQTVLGVLLGIVGSLVELVIITFSAKSTRMSYVVVFIVINFSIAIIALSSRWRLFGMSLLIISCIVALIFGGCALLLQGLG